MPKTEQPRYTLYLRGGVEIDGETQTKKPDIELATAIGSPFWTDIYNLAKDQYGEDNVFCTFG